MVPRLISLFYLIRVITFFRKSGLTEPVEIQLPYLEYTYKMWRYWMTQEPANFNKQLGNGTRLNPIIELAKKMMGQSDFTLASIYSLLDELLPKENGKKIREMSKKLYDELTVSNNFLLLIVMVWMDV